MSPIVQSVLRTARGILLAAAFALAPAVATGQGCPCGTLADEFRAADAGLVREWIVQVPFDSGAWRLADVVVGDGLVVARSGDGGLHAIRTSGSGGAPAGTVAWSRTIAAAAGHAWPPTIGSQLVVLSSELAIHAIARDTGTLEWERPVDATTAAAAVQSDDWVYAPLSSARILRLPVNPRGRPAPKAPAEPPASAARQRGKPAAPPMPPERLDPVSLDLGGRLDAAPLPIDDGVLWSTDNGLVALDHTPLGWIRYALPEVASPTWVRRAPVTLGGPPVVRDSSVYVTTAGSLTRIDLNAENRPGLRTVWSAVLPDRTASGPLVSGDVVVVSLGPSGIVAYSAGDGTELWRSALVGTLVATAGGRAWLLDEMGRLSALDLATGSRRESTCLGCFTLPVVTTIDGRLVLASPGGVVVSLAPPPAPARPVTADDRPAGAPEARDPAATPP